MTQCIIPNTLQEYLMRSIKILTLINKINHGVPLESRQHFGSHFDNGPSALGTYDVLENQSKLIEDTL